MRAAIYVALLVACIAAAPELTRTVVASSAAVVFETLPYVAAATLLAPLFGRFAPSISAFAGCGCSNGPGARSIPAALACAALFGPYVALARWIAAAAVATVRGRSSCRNHDAGPPLLGDLAALAPAAVLAGVLNALAPAVALAHRSPLMQIAAGATLGFAATPCALGGIALASSLHAQSPLASAAMLCVAGILDLRVWWQPHFVRVRRDGATYAIIALACAIVAYEHGASLVHPRLTLPLWCAAAVCAHLALRSSNSAAASQRMFAALLAAVAFLGAPPPPYVATEATLDTIYPGERIDFTGAYEASTGAPHVIRYAITCCRADARPVGIALANDLRVVSGTWVNVVGVVRRHGDELVVAAARITQVAPPADPFVYL